MNTRPPVTDWATDFDHLDAAFVKDPYPIVRELRQRCPVAHTDRYVGAYYPTKYEDVRAIAYDTKNFSSLRTAVREVRAEPAIYSPPLTSDPPHHRPARMVLLPAFTPKEVKRHEPFARAICKGLIDRFIEGRGCDGAVEYAQEIPTRVMARMLGVPEDHGPLFRKWVRESLEIGQTDIETYKRVSQDVDDYMMAEVRKRRASETDDLISYLTKAKLDGELMSDRDIVSMLRLLLLAGIDTTWSAIGISLWHLATHPNDRERLLSEPSLIPVAIEEFLRAYAPVTMAREVVGDVEVGGCPMKAGQMVFLPFPAANRDPAVFPDPDEVKIDRAVNQHAAFGLGIHRCLGSNLARMELNVAIEEFLDRIPEFHLDGSKEMSWSASFVRGPRLLPLIFDRKSDR
jgi:cytochrome P450